MLRIFVFLIFIVLAAAGITWLGALEGFTTMRVDDNLIDVHSGFLLGTLAAIIILIICGTLIVSGLARLPKNIRRQREESRRTKGLIALTRGLEAVAAGDAADAQRHAKSAMKQLDDPGITRLLTAQAAQLAGDEVTAHETFATMLEAPETEFLGLRGLYLQAMSAGDHKEARGYAERAFRLRPGADWAYQSVFTLNIDRGAWGDARDALQLAKQNGLEEGEPANRKEAALLTAQAYGAENAEDFDTAMKDAEAALKKAPGFAPAAVLAARLEGAAGRRSKAGKILDDAWEVAPHPAIAKTMSDLYKDEKLERRTARLKRLAEKAPHADESALLIAEQDIALGEFDSAQTTLSTLLTRNPRARTFSAMASVMEGLHGRDAAQYWLDRAAGAPLDPIPGADGVFNFTTDGWQRLIREFGDYGRLAPPPLEEIHTHLSIDEVKLLTAAPAQHEPEEETTDAEADEEPETAMEAENDETVVEAVEVTDAPAEAVAEEPSSDDTSEEADESEPEEVKKSGTDN